MLFYNQQSNLSPLKTQYMLSIKIFRKTHDSRKKEVENDP